MNGWDEAKKLVEYKLSKLDSIEEKIDRIELTLARLEERHSRAGAVAGAVTGFLAGLTGWLK